MTDWKNLLRERRGTVMRTRKAFTLIELLVVISIIGLLASLSIVSLNSARMKARDALRLADMAQLRTALNMYYDDNDRYPISVYSVDWNDDDSLFGTSAQDGADSYLNDLVPELQAGLRPVMPDSPEDPKNPTNDYTLSSLYLYRYISIGNGSEYAVVYHLEEELAVPKHIRGW